MHGVGCKLVITSTYLILIVYLTSCVVRISCTPTIYPHHNFNANKDADTICWLARKEPEYYQDNDKLARMICHRSRDQRLRLKEEFDKFKLRPTSFCGHDIDSYMCAQGELSYCQLIEDAFKTEQEIYLHDLHREFRMLKKTDNDVIVEILLSIPPLEKAKFREAYDKAYGNLENDFENLDEHFKSVAIELSKRERQPEKPVDLELAKREADLLISGIGEWKKHTCELDRILMETPLQQLNATLHEFRAIHEKPLEKVIGRKMKHKVKKKAYKAMVTYAYNPYDYYAQRIQDAVDGWGTNDHTLNRIISIRCEIDLAEIAASYLLNTADTLIQAIKSDTTGHQEQLLRCLAGDKGHHEF